MTDTQPTDAAPTGGRQYFRNVISVEILSAVPWTNDQLSDLSLVHYAITEGDSSGHVTVTTPNETVDAARMATLLIAQGSDPGFLLGDDDPDNTDPVT